MLFHIVTNFTRILRTLPGLFFFIINHHVKLISQTVKFSVLQGGFPQTLTTEFQVTHLLWNKAKQL